MLQKEHHVRVEKLSNEENLGRYINFGMRIGGGLGENKRHHAIDFFGRTGIRGLNRFLIARRITDYH
jgi:hypothetical protein